VRKQRVPKGDPFGPSRHSGMRADLVVVPDSVHRDTRRRAHTPNSTPDAARRAPRRGIIYAVRAPYVGFSTWFSSHCRTRSQPVAWELHASEELPRDGVRLPGGRFAFHAPLAPDTEVRVPAVRAIGVGGPPPLHELLRVAERPKHELGYAMAR
jgi:hypothetical protein